MSHSVSLHQRLMGESSDQNTVGFLWKDEAQACPQKALVLSELG